MKFKLAMVLVGVMFLTSFGFITTGIVFAVQNSQTSPVDPNLLAPEDEVSYAAQLLKKVEAENVEVVFTSNPDLNCGAKNSKINMGGCFRHATPTKIYISSGFTVKALTYMVYHEYAHLYQHNNNLPGGECEADIQAQKWGADLTVSSYPECELVNNYSKDTNVDSSVSQKQSTHHHH